MDRNIWTFEFATHWFIVMKIKRIQSHFEILEYNSSAKELKNGCFL